MINPWKRNKQLSNLLAEAKEGWEAEKVDSGREARRHQFLVDEWQKRFKDRSEEYHHLAKLCQQKDGELKKLTEANGQATKLLDEGNDEAAKLRAQLTDLDATLHREIKVSNRLAKERNRFRAALGLLDAIAKLPPTESQYLGVLALADDETPWWVTVLHILTRQQREEASNALLPNLSSEARHYNAGRAAALADHLDCLLQLRAKALEENKV